MITLVQGLTDLSKELGEATTNTSARRIQHYNDAVQEFANERKWPFLVKQNSALTTGSGTGPVSIVSIEDMRMPGGIKELTIADESEPFLPISYEDRLIQADRNRFYITPDEQNIKFTKEVEPNKAINLWYWYIPERIEAIESDDEFPIPARYRKILGVLAGAFVQYSRYLDNQGGRMINYYQRLLAKAETNQAETNSGTPKRLENPMSWRGQFRKYPPYSRGGRR